MTELHTRAVTIGVTDYGDSDKIVTFYSEKFGKITGIAKGAKRSKKRFVNKLEFFSLLDLTLNSSGKSPLLRLDQAEIIKTFHTLCEDYRKYTAAMLIIELIRVLTRENDRDEDLFQLLTWGLEILIKKDEIAETLALFQLKLLDITGFLPQLTRCVFCRREPSGRSAFVPSADGILCPDCLPLTDLSPLKKLSLNTIKTLKMARSLPLEKLSRIKLTYNSSLESLQMFKTCITYLLQREILSWQELEKIIGTKNKN
ncbi:MAG: DNA repair protein RecO [Thermodesulfobacteriota bacterium]